MTVANWHPWDRNNLVSPTHISHCHEPESHSKVTQRSSTHVVQPYTFVIHHQSNTLKCPCSPREPCSLCEPNPAPRDAYVFLFFPISYVIQLIPMTLNHFVIASQHHSNQLNRKIGYWGKTCCPCLRTTSFASVNASVSYYRDGRNKNYILIRIFFKEFRRALVLWNQEIPLKGFIGFKVSHTSECRGRRLF